MSARTKKPFQFSLRRLFLATTLVSAAFALLAFWLQQLHSASEFHTNGAELIWIVGPFAILALIGSGVGALRGNAMQGAEDGILIGVVLMVVGAILFIAVRMILSVVQPFLS